jgi:hypothetical protein
VDVRAATSVTGMEGSVKNKILFFNRGGGAKQKTYKKYTYRCFAPRPLHDFIFFTVLECLARLFAEATTNKCLHSASPCGLPKEAKVVRWDGVPGRAVGLGWLRVSANRTSFIRKSYFISTGQLRQGFVAQRMELVQLLLQSFRVLCSVAFHSFYCCVSTFVLGLS